MGQSEKFLNLLLAVSLFVVIAVVTICVWSVAHAEIVIKTSPREANVVPTKSVAILGYLIDPNKNTTSMMISACGSIVTVTATENDVKIHGNEIEQKADLAIKAACEGEL